MIDRAVIGTLFLHPELFAKRTIEERWFKDKYKPMFNFLYEKSGTHPGLPVSRETIPFREEDIDLCVERANYEFFDDMLDGLQNRFLTTHGIDTINRRIGLIKSSQSPTVEFQALTQDINDLVASESRAKEVHNYSYASEFMDVVTLSMNSEGRSVTGISTGNETLDSYFGGWQPGNQVVCAGRPFMGKTTQAIRWALEAVKQGKSVLFFSLEMTAIEVYGRFIAEVSGIDSSKIVNGGIGNNEFVAYQKAVDVLSPLPLFIDEDSLSLSAIQRQSRIIKARFGLDMIVVDYLQLVSLPGNGKSANERTTEVSREMKLLAKELKVTNMALSQLNRGVEQRADKRPLLSDLRDSGAIEQDADVVIMFFRPGYYDSGFNPTQMEWIVRKNRPGGITGTIEIKPIHAEFIDPIIRR